MEKKDSLVLELQALASQESTAVPELLRKALVVATKLKSTGFRRWVENELHGYEGEVPDYRKLRAQLMAKNPYHGLIPFVIPNDKMMDMICNVEVRDPVGSLTDLMENPRSDTGYLHFPMPPGAELELMKIQDTAAPLQPIRRVARNQVASVLDEIRSVVLEWSLKLEAEGILGEGMTFSKDEVNRAAVNKSINIESFQGILGDVTGSMVTQDLDMNVRQGDIDSLKDFLLSRGLAKKDVEELGQAIEQDPKPADRGSLGECVGAWIGKMVGKAACGAWNVGVSAAGKLLADSVSKFYGE